MIRALRLAALLLALVACGPAPGSNATETQPQPGEFDSGNRKPAKSPGSKMSDKSVDGLLPGASKGYQQVLVKTTIDGIALAEHEGPTALVVFASWCGHCRVELAVLARLRERHPTLRIIGVNGYEDFGGNSNQDRLRAYIAGNAPWLTEIVHANDALLADFGGVPKIPTLFVYDAQGRVVEEFRRGKRAKATEAELDAAFLKATR